jgi:single-stranded-DNA-specific exonuclease
MAIIGVSGKIWEIKSSLDSKSKLDINRLTTILLENRGIKDKKEKEFFLNPPHPFKLKASDVGLDEEKLEEAVAKIKEVGRKGQSIIIYGDYDADGITGSAILWEALYSRGFKVLPYLPDRAKEGYGVRAESVARLKKKYPDLGMIITVDNGIVAFDEVKKIKEMGLEVIVSDHHKKGDKISLADIVIHTEKISGAGVSWFLSSFLKKRIKSEKPLYDNDGLDLLAIGTIADQMPLVGVNRSFAKYGIEAINNTKRKGLIELFKEAGIKKGEIGTYEMNYVIAPRINAMGRISHALESLRLLCIKNQEKARELALHLGRVNRERQNIVDRLLEKARAKVMRELGNKVLIVKGRNYNEGVIGLVAGKLVEEFYRPAVVISEKKGVSKASVRSIAGFDITKGLREFGDMFESLGGHSMAAGFSIKTDKIDDFKDSFIKYANQNIKDNILKPRLYVDLELDFDLIDNKLLETLSVFEPLGVGNPSPIFLSRGVRVLDAKNVGKDGKHLRLVLNHSQRVFEAVAFGFGNSSLNVLQGAFLDLVFSIEKNVWNGVESIQLKLKDFRIV